MSKRRRVADHTDALVSDTSELGMPSLSGFPSISLSVRQSTSGKGAPQRGAVARSANQKDSSTSSSASSASTSVVSFEGDDELHGASALLGFGVQNPGKPSAPAKKKNAGSFQGMDLSREVFKAVMRRGYSVPTPIQRKTIPLILAGADVAAMARTGSGKTAAFGIPLVQKLKQHSMKIGARGLILSPTRELAIQTLKFIRQLCHFCDLRSVLIVGGEKMDSQFEDLARNPDIIVATPGRLMHHILEVDLKLASVEYVVFDEADRLFEMGFAEQIQQILDRMTHPRRQTLLFSATMPRVLVDFAKAGLHEPKVVRLDTDTTMSDKLQMQFFSLRPGEKNAALLFLLRNVIKPQEQAIIFAATRHHVDFISFLLRSQGIYPSMIYGSMDATARNMNINRFRARKTQYLVVTDVAARGIDIPLLDVVIHYDFPARPKLFVHRSGRVARAGREGTAYSLVTFDELAYMIDLHRFLGKDVRVSTAEDLEKEFDPRSVYYGALPSQMMSLCEESVNEAIKNVPDLQSLLRTVKNASEQYRTTRTKASKSSREDAKKLPHPDMHPMFANLKEVAAFKYQDDFLKQISNFRPNQTIFEHISQQKGTKAKLYEKSLEHLRKVKESDQLTMDVSEEIERSSAEASGKVRKDGEESSGAPASESRKKRLTKRERELLKAGKALSSLKQDREHKRRKRAAELESEKSHYLDLIPQNKFTEDALRVGEGNAPQESENIYDAILDLMPDEGASLLKHRQTTKWDRRKKKYVKVSSSDALSNRTKNEAGVSINTKKNYEPKLYKQWKEKTKMYIPTAGDVEDGKLTAMLPSRRGPRGRNQTPTSLGASTEAPPGRKGPVNEVRSAEDVRKYRQKKEFQKIKQKKGWKKTTKDMRQRTDRKVLKASRPTRSKLLVKRK
mmetsp:Transcript_45797/g.115299  ORF Transcript_45797/g.115299 Transcript_45797/m.115299 type:complete len:903 (+) Transcript_45797:85-2793(+)